MHANTSKAVREVLWFEAWDFSVFERINLLQMLCRPEKHNHILLRSQRRDAQTARHISGIQTVATLANKQIPTQSCQEVVPRKHISCVYDKIYSAKDQIWAINEHDSSSQCLWFLQISLVGQRSLFSNSCLRGIQHECFIEGIAQLWLTILSDKRAEGL